MTDVVVVVVVVGAHLASRWAPAWRIHTNLYKFGGNISPHILLKTNCRDPNLGEGLCIFTFFVYLPSFSQVLTFAKKNIVKS